MNHERMVKMTIAALLVAIDVVTSPLFRIEGLAPMSSVLNVIIGVLVNPLYALIITFMTGTIRILILGIPPLALTGAVFGGVLASIAYQIFPKVWSAWIGEIIGTGIIGSLLSYPVMVLYTGTHNGLFWFIYTPKFVFATLVGGIIGVMATNLLLKNPHFLRIQKLFKS